MLLNHYYEGLIEAGCDEAGRGCLAGPVYAAAVILPPDYHNEILNDSKQLTEKKRYMLREQIERDAVAWAVGTCTAQEIDDINILHASYLAMHRAIDQLTVRPQALIIDGNRFDPYYPIETDSPPALPVREGAPAEKSNSSALPHREWQGERPRVLFPLPYTTIIKGDGKYLSIAAASILAKTYRDDYMNALAEEFPQYDWLSNKGYPTKKHRAAIAEYGPTPHHRMTFTLT